MKKKIIRIRIHNFCNLDCSHCYVKTNDPVYDIKHFHAAINELENIILNKNYNTAAISGGEPLVTERYLFKLVEFLHSHNIHNIILATNGTLVNNKLLNKIKNRNVKLAFSIHNITLKMINKCINNNIKHSVNFVFSKSNKEQTLSYLEKVPFETGIVLYHMTPIENTISDELGIDEWHDLIKFVWKKYYGKFRRISAQPLSIPNNWNNSSNFNCSKQTYEYLTFDMARKETSPCGLLIGLEKDNLEPYVCCYYTKLGFKYPRSKKHNMISICPLTTFKIEELMQWM